MPGFDRSGPVGEGPMTGRKRGYCAGGQKSGDGFARGLGRPFGRGLGMGSKRGFRYGAFQGRWFSKSNEKEALHEELRALEQKKEEIKNQLEELEK